MDTTAPNYIELARTKVKNLFRDIERIANRDHRAVAWAQSSLRPYSQQATLGPNWISPAEMPVLEIGNRPIRLAVQAIEQHLHLGFYYVEVSAGSQTWWAWLNRPSDESWHFGDKSEPKGDIDESVVSDLVIRAN